MSFYDALDFAGNPMGASPLPTSQIVFDHCGRFRATDIARPALGFLAVVVDDHVDSLEDEYVPTSVIVGTGSGEAKFVPAPVTRHTTDIAWTSSAGDPFGGLRFSEKGVVVTAFLYQGTPLPGVVVTRAGSPVPSEDFYFAESDGVFRSTIDPLKTGTGPNGTALLVGSQLVNHSGIGGQLGECEWTTQLAVSLPGFIVYRESDCE